MARQLLLLAVLLVAGIATGYAATSAKPTIYQLDVCDQHNFNDPTQPRSFVLNFDGLTCTIVAYTIKTGCKTTTVDPIFTYSIPCTKGAPAGVPQMASQGLWTALSPSQPGKQTCDLYSYNGEYEFHYPPTSFNYGYHVNRVPCSANDRKHGVLPPAPKKGSLTVPIDFGYTLLPSNDQLPSNFWRKFPGTAGSVPTKPGTCKLVFMGADAAETTFVSKTSYPCILIRDPQTTFGPTCC